MGKKSRAAKKAVKGLATDDGSLNKAPHTMIFHRGQVGKNVNELVRDTRRVMAPFTAAKLKVNKKNVLKDFVNVAGPLNVSHFMIFTKTDVSVNLRVCRLPRGPTLTFRVNEYSLHRDIVSTLKRHNMEPKQFLHHPLLVMNGFTGEGMHFKLLATMFQNMLPSININKVKLSEIRRCLLLNYNEQDDTIDFRHYNIRAVPVGMSRGVKKLVRAKLPNMSRFEDVSDLLFRGGELSESEAEQDGEHNEVILPQTLASRGNIKSSKSAIRLTEIGPRMKLQLVKIEEGICDGAVLHHAFVDKTEEELQLMREMRKEQKKIVDQRKKEQERNIKKKQKEKELHKEKSLAGMKKADSKEKEDEDSQAKNPGGDPESSEDETAKDIEYFKEEVGEAPDPELFPSRKPGMKRKRKGKPSQVPFKKKKVDHAQDGSASKKDKFSGKNFQKGDRDLSKKFSSGDKKSPGKKFQGKKFPPGGKFAGKDDDGDKRKGKFGGKKGAMGRGKQQAKTKKKEGGFKKPSGFRSKEGERRETKKYQNKNRKSKNRRR